MAGTPETDYGNFKLEPTSSSNAQAEMKMTISQMEETLHGNMARDMEFMFDELEERLHSTIALQMEAMTHKTRALELKVKDLTKALDSEEAARAKLARRLRTQSGRNDELVTNHTMLESSHTMLKNGHEQLERRHSAALERNAEEFERIHQKLRRGLARRDMKITITKGVPADNVRRGRSASPEL